jgi:hypothetical protein
LQYAHDAYALSPYNLDSPPHIHDFAALRDGPESQA